MKFTLAVRAIDMINVIIIINLPVLYLLLIIIDIFKPSAYQALGFWVPFSVFYVCHSVIPSHF